MDQRPKTGGVGWLPKLGGDIHEPIDERLNTSMSWGGTFPDIYDWESDAQKLILLRDTEPEVAAHEFGHTLDLGDAYKGFFRAGCGR